MAGMAQTERSLIGKWFFFVTLGAQVTMGETNYLRYIIHVMQFLFFLHIFFVGCALQ